MPTLTNVVINDGTDDHTFTPRGIDPSGVATLVKSSGVPIGDERLTVGRTRTSAGREKTLLKLTLPVVQDVVVSGVSRPTIVRAAYMEVSFSFDATSSTAERGKALALAADLLVDTSVLAVVRDLQVLY
jgi:hypothetical protein